MPPCMTAMTRTLFVVPPVTPNPSLKLTRYGWLCEPGLWHMVHHHRPGSHSRLRRQLSAHVRPRTPRKAPLQGLRDLQHLEVPRSGHVRPRFGRGRASSVGHSILRTWAPLALVLPASPRSKATKRRRLSSRICCRQVQSRQLGRRSSARRQAQAGVNPTSRSPCS
jgi:hypothetical protein